MFTLQETSRYYIILKNGVEFCKCSKGNNTKEQVARYFNINCAKEETIKMLDQATKDGEQIKNLYGYAQAYGYLASSIEIILKYLKDKRN